jgi:hypothetical protein
MMDQRLISVERPCPYCGESVELLIDCSAPRQRYTEDCAVCCQPLVVAVVVHGPPGGGSDVADDADELEVTLAREAD